MDEEHSPGDLEVARILVALRQLVWDADHRCPSTHGLRWGARKRRSAAAGDPEQSPDAASRGAAPAPSLALLIPLAPPAEEVAKRPAAKPTAAAAAAPALPPKAAGPEARLGYPAAEVSEEAGAARWRSSPETPLEFCSSAEENDALAADAAAAAACPPEPERPPAKKPKLSFGKLSKQAHQLNLAKTELQKEAAEIRNRLEALRERNFRLIELRIKLEKEDELQRKEGRGCLDLLPMAPVRAAAAAGRPQQQHYHQPWPQQWLSNHIAYHRAAQGFPVHPPAAEAAAGKRQWNWAPSWVSTADGGDRGGDSRAGKAPDLVSCPDLEPGLAPPPPPPPRPQQGSFCYYQQQEEVQQPPQALQRTSLLEEQRAARKRRMEVIQRRRRRRGAAACGGDKSGSFR